MIYSIVGEIMKLRNGRSLIIDYQNSNRYRLIAIERDESRTAYCFSVPVYNAQTKKIIDLTFHSQNDCYDLQGSNAHITLGQVIQMQNADGICQLSMDSVPSYVDNQHIKYGTTTLYPTPNGIACKVSCTPHSNQKFILTCDNPFLGIRENNKYFALMSDEFKPFVTVSCIGTIDNYHKVIAPAEIHYEKINDQQYAITVSSTSPIGKFAMFEINLYESKLFQDTTVESRNPQMNNAFGGVAFIGDTVSYGEQWLYTRPDFSKIPELLTQQINQAVLHLPKLSQSDISLSAFRVVRRFCSFGSNWNNKIEMDAALSDSMSILGYQSIDISNLVIDPRTTYLTPSEGLILRTTKKGSGFIAVATGDSYFAPQILEINFR